MVIAASFGASGCSSSTSGSGHDGAFIVPMDPATSGAPHKNPEGVAYPTDNLGTRARLDSWLAKTGASAVK